MTDDLCMEPYARIVDGKIVFADGSRLAHCTNGHELRIVRGTNLEIRAVATISPYTETWEFVDAAFCPECGGEIVA
jgi:hypothetical protein